jgi:hypothetical protein
VKEHGFGVTLYRTINTVKKTSDLTIYCILAQLESYRERTGHFPETLYVQIDGGAENANRFVFATMELLVVKRMVCNVVVTRLPAGKSLSYNCLFINRFKLRLTDCQWVYTKRVDG